MRIQRKNSMMTIKLAMMILARRSLTNLKIGYMKEEQNTTNSRLDIILQYIEASTQQEILKQKKRFYLFQRNKLLLLKWRWKAQ